MTRFFILENPKFKSFYVLNPEGEVFEFQKGAFQKTEFTPYELLNDTDIQEVPDESFFPGRVLNSYTNTFSDELERVGAQDQIQGYGGSTIYNEDMVNPPNELQELAPGANTQAFNSGIQQIDDQFEECYTNDSTYQDQSRQSKRNAMAKRVASVLNTEGLVPKRVAYKFKYEIDYLDKEGQTKTFDIEAAGQKEAISLFTRLKGKEADVIGARNKGPLKPSEEKTAEEQVKHNFNHVSLPKPSNGMPFKKAQKQKSVYHVYFKDKPAKSMYAENDADAHKKAKELFGNDNTVQRIIKTVKNAQLKKKVAQVQNTYKVKFIDKHGKPSTVIVHAESAAEVKKNLKSEKIVKQVLLITPVEGKEREGDYDLEQSGNLDKQMTYNGIGDATESPSRYPQEPEAVNYKTDSGDGTYFDPRVAFVKVYAAQGDDPNLTPTVDAHTGLGDCNNSAIPNQAPASTGTNANQPEELQESPGWRKRTKAQVLTDDAENPQQAIAPAYPEAKSNSSGQNGYGTKAPTQNSNSSNTGDDMSGGGQAAPPKPGNPPPNQHYILQNNSWVLAPIS